jgi:LytS/YehU family sensor histidine kinase
MNSTRFLYWGAQLFGWSLYGILMTLSLYAYHPKKIDSTLLTQVISFLFLAITFTHLMRNFFIKYGWLEMKLTPLIPRIIVSSILCASCIILGNEIINIIIGFDSEKNISILKILIEILANSFLILFWNAMYFTYHFFSKSRKQELNNLSLEANRNEIELKNLRTQLNPHFLFNSLNSIRALIEIEPIKAKNSVTALSNLLRKSLMFGKTNLVTIEDEIEMVSNYLDLEKIRFEERLTVKWNLSTEINNFHIPPFSIQMLVENAIKHGISTLIEGGEILITTLKTNNTISIVVENSGTLKTEIDLGIGIENTRRRLDLQFKDAAEFIIYQKENKVISSITFKL